jgi:heterodisulfide reductase subunit B2
MKAAYFPGCSVHAMAREYDQTARLVCGRLSIELQEVEDWNCCGATAAHSLDHELSTGLNARNLAIVNRMNLDKLTTPCAGCFNRLKSAAIELKNSPSLRKKIASNNGNSMDRVPEVSHLLKMLSEDVGLEALSEPVTNPLKGLRLAAYYGCLITRPKKVAEFDDPEQPKSMDRILQALGAETVAWSHKAECCGGSFAASETGIVLDLGGQVLEAARQAHAEAIVVACPMCQANLDARQHTIENERRISYNLPVIYFTQLIGLAYGFSIDRTGLRRLLVSPLPLLEKKGLVWKSS